MLQADQTLGAPSERWCRCSRCWVCSTGAAPWHALVPRLPCSPGRSEAPFSPRLKPVPHLLWRQHQMWGELPWRTQCWCVLAPASLDLERAGRAEPLPAGEAAPEPGTGKGAIPGGTEGQAGPRACARIPEHGSKPTLRAPPREALPLAPLPCHPFHPLPPLASTGGRCWGLLVSLLLCLHWEGPLAPGVVPAAVRGFSTPPLADAPFPFASRWEAAAPGSALPAAGAPVPAGGGECWNGLGGDLRRRSLQSHEGPGPWQQPRQWGLCSQAAPLPPGSSCAAEDWWGVGAGLNDPPTQDRSGRFELLSAAGKQVALLSCCPPEATTGADTRVDGCRRRRGVGAAGC